MYNMEIWRLATDILLAGALIYLALRMLKKPADDTSALELQGLEQSLRRVVQEADQSSRTLGGELLRRKQDLEKLLFDLGTVEHRLNRAINSAEERKGNLELECSRASQIESDLHMRQQQRPHVAAPAAQASPAVPLTQAVERTVTPTPVVPEIIVEAPEPPSFEITISRTTSAAQSAVNRSTVAYNIYGDPVETARTSSAVEDIRGPMFSMQNPSLVSRIEKEVRQPARTEGQGKKVVEDIFSAAEEMIRAGQDLNQIAARTDLPLEDLQMLSQVVRREQAMQKDRAGEEPLVDLEQGGIDSAVAFSTSDQRLGVLGGIKRQVQVL